MYNKILDSEFYRVAKLFKRLHVVDATDNIVYTPPDFLRDRMQREKLQELVIEFNKDSSDYIKCVVQFEMSFGE